MSFGCDMLNKEDVSDEAIKRLCEFAASKDAYILLDEVVENNEQLFLIGERLKTGKMKVRWLTKTEFFYGLGDKCKVLFHANREPYKLNSYKCYHVLKKGEEFVFDLGELDDIFKEM